MKLWVGVRVLLTSWLRRLLRARLRPEDVVDHLIERLMASSRQLHLHLAECIVNQRHTARQIEDGSSRGGSQELAALLESQLHAQADRIARLRQQISQIEGQVQLLRAERAEVALRGTLLSTQRELQRMLADLGVTRSEDVWRDLKADLERQEAIQQVYQELLIPGGSRSVLEPGKQP